MMQLKYVYLRQFLALAWGPYLNVSNYFSEIVNDWHASFRRTMFSDRRMVCALRRSHRSFTLFIIRLEAEKEKEKRYSWHVTLNNWRSTLRNIYRSFVMKTASQWERESFMPLVYCRYLVCHSTEIHKPWRDKQLLACLQRESSKRRVFFSFLQVTRLAGRQQARKCFFFLIKSTNTEYGRNSAPFNETSKLERRRFSSVPSRSLNDSR